MFAKAIFIVDRISDAAVKRCLELLVQAHWAYSRSIFGRSRSGSDSEGIAQEAFAAASVVRRFFGRDWNI
jgi:hypothetical protein